MYTMHMTRQINQKVCRIAYYKVRWIYDGVGCDANSPWKDADIHPSPSLPCTHQKSTFIPVMLMMISSSTVLNARGHHPSSTSAFLAPCRCWSHAHQSSPPMSLHHQRRSIHASTRISSRLAAEVAQITATAAPATSTTDDADGTSSSPLKINIYQMTDEELTSYLVDIMKQPKYRSKQIRTCEYCI